MEEVWKYIFDYPNYQVSNLGRIRSLKTYKILKLKKNKDGYLVVCLCKYSKKHTIFVHRLVAKAFVPNYNNYTVINHKDEDKTNNIYTNLEWCTQKYNVNYGTRIKRIKDVYKNKRYNKMIEAISNTSVCIKSSI